MSNALTWIPKEDCEGFEYAEPQEAITYVVGKAFGVCAAAICRGTAHKVVKPISDKPPVSLEEAKAQCESHWKTLQTVCTPCAKPT